MEDVNKKQWQIFEISCAVVAFVLLVKLLPLIPLYMNPDLRTHVGVLVQATAKREGWLLSGLSIRNVSEDSVELLYRSHVRGTDPVQCHSLGLKTGKLFPCANF